MQLRRFRFRRGLMRANRVIAVSDATRRDVENLMGVPPDRIRRVYNAPDPGFLQRRARRSRRKAAHPGALPDQLPVPALRRQHPPAQERAATGGGVRGGARAARHPRALPGSAPGDHRRHDLAVPRGAAGGDQEPRGTRGAVPGLRAFRNPAVLLRDCRGLRFPLALRRLRTAAARSHGLRQLRSSPPTSARCPKWWAMPPCW